MKAKIVKKVQETPDIASYFLKPAASIKFIPGHFVYLGVALKYPDKRENLRHMSIANSPTEKYLQITFRKGISGYKRTLASLKIGDIVELSEAQGVYSWPPKRASQHVFIAGGVGIAPFRSRIKFNIDRNLKNKIYLVYSNKSVANTAYYKELVDWSKTYPFLEIEFIETSKRGRISKNDLGKVHAKYKNATYWVCGSPLMVDDIEDMLLEMSIDADRIKTEKFTGY